MTLSDIQFFPVAESYLCEDCACVGNCSEQCPACASEALLALAGVLNREAVQTDERVRELIEDLDRAMV